MPSSPAGAAAAQTPPPYLTPDLPGIGGHIKQQPEDFRVEELPLYRPRGEGTHVYFGVEKVGLPTAAAVRRLAGHLGVRPDQIGVAGLKDAHAVTTQMMSLEHVDPEALAAYRDRQVRVTWTSRHTNKLRPGHLAGNRFAIRIRGVGAADLPAARAVLDVLRRRGVPNYFGHQRFGARGDTAALGAALVRQDLQQFLTLLLGGPRADDPPDCRAARDAYEAGYIERALQRWPRHYANERRALAALKRSRKCAPAVAAVDKRMRRFYVSAFQSAIFNAVLAERVQTIDRVFAGDLARKTDTGGVFRVEDEAADNARAADGQISPTGPLLGYRCNLADGPPGRIERDAIAAHGVTGEDFRAVRGMKVKGGRRALRFLLADAALTAAADDRGEYLELTFTAPPGAYATVALREIMKPG
jgi:tRNA pseudouridine13 synthase